MLATGPARAEAPAPGASLYGMYVLSLTACLLGNLLIWAPRLDPPDIVLIPAVLVAIGIALARRRYQ